jgi:hypothetical protein
MKKIWKTGEVEKYKYGKKEGGKEIMREDRKENHKICQ